ncbi:MAG: hypothetical protein IKV88_05490 [Clostridia bacterium]|nr:hypothetical protein [Clostridia bacterium]
MTISNEKMRFEINEKGAMTSLFINDDKYDANFALSSKDEPWVPENKQWGLGFITSGFNRVQIENCVEKTVDKDKMSATYLLEYTDTRPACVWNGDIEKSKRERKVFVTVTRELKSDGLYETIEIKNESKKYIILDEVGIYSSFRDTYATGENVLHTHINQHICTMGDLCYIEAQRQSNIGKNLALITLEGNFSTYHLEEQNTSNHRGVIALVSKDIRIPSGKSHIFKRVITEYEKRDDFEEKLCAYTGYPVLDYGFMTIEKGDKISIKVKNSGKLTSIRLDGEVLEENNGKYEYTPSETGVKEGIIKYNGKIARITYKVTDSVRKLMEKRVKFIVENQQITDPDDPLYGAYMPYDIEKEKIFRAHEDAYGYYHCVPDRNEVRERMGMGAFIALYSRIYNDKKYLPSLELYRDFMLKYIVDENYDVWDSYLRQDSEFYYNEDIILVPRKLDMRSRAHNYTFAIPFFIQMYLLTGEEIYSKTAVGIMKRYYEIAKEGGFMPMLYELKPETLNVDDDFYAARLSKILDGERKIAEKTRDMAGNYFSGEVAYEHGHPSSNLKYLTQYYISTKDESVMDAIKDEALRTDSFNGNQPHFNQNGVPIRHWDAFWFGKYELWGDTFPHWVSCLSTCGYTNYYMITKDESYRDKAKKIFMANIALIQKDGSSYNSYIFNEKSHGRPAGRYDALSSDQDWIFYYYLQYCEAGVFEL